MQKSIFVLAAAIALALPACGAAEQPRRGAAAGLQGNRPGGAIALKKIGEFDEPVYVTGAPGFPRLLFVVEQQGRVVVLSDGRRRGAFLDLRAQVGYGGERAAKFMFEHRPGRAVWLKPQER